MTQIKTQQNKDFEGLKDLVDDRAHTVYVSHIFRGDKDVCLENFGEQNEECIKHNAKTSNSGDTNK